MQAYSMDLRERALLDSDAGMKAADVAVKYRRDLRRTDDRRCPAPASRLAGVPRALTRWCVARGGGVMRCAGRRS